MMLLMAATTQSLVLVASVEEKDWLQKKSRGRSFVLPGKVYPASLWWVIRSSSSYSDFNPKATQNPLLIDGWYNPLSVGEELRSGGPMLSSQASHAELCKSNHEVIHDQCTAFATLPQSQAGERNRKVFRDEGSAFVASLR
eukprot:c2399_g1_i1 orf=3-422(-)